MILLCLQTTSAFAQRDYDKDILNFGVKVGLNALSTTKYNMYYDDQLQDNKLYKNTNGYLANVFLRVNLDHFFFQPELEYNTFSQELKYSFPTEAYVASSFEQNTLDIKGNTLNTYGLVGYNFVKNGPYLFNVYTGICLTSVFQTSYHLNDDTKFTDKEDSYNFGGVIGFSFNISMVHFDIRYKLNGPNTNLDFSGIDGFPEEQKPFKIKKNENQLSFSCGVMF